MKFSVASQDIIKELQVLSGAISNNTVLPILEDFLFDLNGGTLKISASDLETTMSSEISVQSSDKGKIAIPAKNLLETIKAIGNQGLDFDIDDDSLAVTIKTTTGKYKLIGENGTDFPAIPNTESSKEVEMEASVLSKAISRTLFAASNDELRPAMTGVFFELNTDGAYFVATDAHKLVKYGKSSIQNSENTSFIVPKKAMSLLKTALNNADGLIKVAYNPTNAFFDLGNVKLVCRLIESKFPDYNTVIPNNNPNILTLNRKDFQDALKRISIYASRTTNQVVLDVKDGEIGLFAQDADYSNEAKESMKSQYQGDEMEIAFNAKFLVEILGVLETEEVVFELSSPAKAGILVPSKKDEDEELVMLVMPIMINNMDS